MLGQNESIWHTFKSVIGRLGHWLYIHFKHITGGVRHVADKIHGLNLGPVSTVAGLVSQGTHIADSIYNYAHDLYGTKPPENNAFIPTVP
jgi:hypothetical protein